MLKKTCEHGIPNYGQYCKIGWRDGLACGRGLCAHGNRKNQCAECRTNKCVHGRHPYFCRIGFDCGLPCGKGICKHRQNKYSCKKCKADMCAGALWRR